MGPHLVGTGQSWRDHLQHWPWGHGAPLSSSTPGSTMRTRGYVKIVTEHGRWKFVSFPLKIVILHSYVSLPEGNHPNIKSHEKPSFSYDFPMVFHNYVSLPEGKTTFSMLLLVTGYSLHPEAADTGQQQAGLRSRGMTLKMTQRRHSYGKNGSYSHIYIYVMLCYVM